jgi:hypothetical protein
MMVRPATEEDIDALVALNNEVMELELGRSLT